MFLHSFAKSISIAVLITAFGFTPTTFGRNLVSPKPHPLSDLQVFTDPGSIPQLTAKHQGSDIPFPLQHTHATVEISGSVAKVELTQTYRNNFETALEGVYVFPMPENSAVSGMKMVIGERVIQATIQEREEAKRTYETAKQEGKTAALLEQERPNIFTQSVANIAPGTDIDVVIEYLQELTYDAGQYEFVFPMVVGPRFFPGESNEGTLDEQANDASRISPPVFGKGQRSGNDISIDLRVSGQSPILDWHTPTHDVHRIAPKTGGLRLKLADHDSIPNRDFILHYKVAKRATSMSVLTHKPPQEDGFFSLTIQPPQINVDKLVGSREIIFVVDVSGSMFGVPLAMSQAAMKEAISKLRPVDTFNIYSFAGRTGKAFNAPRPANKGNLEQGLQYISSLRAGGGTHMANAVREALSPSEDHEYTQRNRYVFFLTDGYVGNEKPLFTAAAKLVRELKQSGQKARVFGFGVGSSVNRHLLDGLSRAGNGITVYASTRQDPKAAVNRFFHYIDRPVLENISIDWGDLEVSSPTLHEDLFASRPLTIHGRYRTAGTERIVVYGEMSGRPIAIPLRVQLPGLEKRNSSLRSVWARKQIEQLHQKTWTTRGQNQGEIKEKVTQLGLQYNLVTAYTSLVAVDSESQIDTQGSQSILQPIHTPEGVNAQMAGARPHKMRSFMSLGAGSITRSQRRGLGNLRPMPTGKFQGSNAVNLQDRSRLKPKGLLKSEVSKEAVEQPTVQNENAQGLSIKSQFQAFLESNACQCQFDKPIFKNALPQMQIRFFLSKDGKVIQLMVTQKSHRYKRLAHYIEKCLRRSLRNWNFNTTRGDLSQQQVFPATILLP